MRGQGVDGAKVSDQELGAGFNRDAEREPGGGVGRAIDREPRTQVSWAADREQGTAGPTQGQWRHRLTEGLQSHGPTRGWTLELESGLPGPLMPEPTGHHRGSEAICHLGH